MKHQTTLYLQIIHGKRWHRWRRKRKNKVVLYYHTIDKIQMIQARIVPWISEGER